MLRALLLNVLTSNQLATAGFIPAFSENQEPHESVSRLPYGWKYHSEAAGNDTVALKLALHQSTSHILRIAEEVSNPRSSQYGQHLSSEELLALNKQDDGVACDDISIWLGSHGIENSACADGYARFRTSVNTANQLLNTTFSNYEHENKDMVIRTKQYSLPEHISKHVDFVYPTIHFFQPQNRPIYDHDLLPRQQGLPSGPTNCSNSVCPQNLTAKYNIDYYPKDGLSGSKIAIAGFIKNFPNKTDVQTFLEEAKLPVQVTVPDYEVVVVKDGPTEVQGDSSLIIEPNLDLDYSLAFTGPIPAFFYTVGGKGVKLSQPGNITVPEVDSNNEPFLDFLEALLAEPLPPQVVSISYSDDEQSVPIKYAQKVCDLMAQAAARGITIVGASGDGGGQGTTRSECIGPDGEPRLIPTFPSSCPWLTSIGATAAYGGPATYSSGGFSNYFPVPDWQANATKAYIKARNGTAEGYYNASGRGIPDISLLGSGYLIKAGGFNQTAKGTSASTPVVASMIALINDIRLRAGKPVLGYINPLLYSQEFAPAIKDVVDEFGVTMGCSNGTFIIEGWEALTGWDAATGLGEPDFAKLRALLE